VMNSKKDIQGDETFDISLGTLRREERGGGPRSRLGIFNTSQDLTQNSVARKKSMVYIPVIEGEHMCCARAIVTSKAKLDGMAQKQFEYFVGSNAHHIASNRTQKGQALALLEAVGLSRDEPVTLRQLHIFEEYLDIQIVVISADLLNEVSYAGNKERTRKIFLYLSHEHFHSITNINKFHPSKLLCPHCLQWYGRKSKYHTCNSKCPVCNRSKCTYDDQTSSVITCADCNYVCRNQECYLAHKEVGTYQGGPNAGEPRPASQCDTWFKCLDCHVAVNRLKRNFAEHECGEYFCKNCKSYVQQDHLCYYRIKKPKKTSGFFLYYDYECSQDSIFQCQDGYSYRPKKDCSRCESLGRLCADCRKCVNCTKSHCGMKQFLPIFLVSQTSCDQCQDDEWSHDAICGSCGDRCSVCARRDKDGQFLFPLCSNGACGKREKVFSGPSTNADFCNWLFSPRHKSFVCMAHNNRSFDAHFILNHLVSNGVTPSVIYDGGKIMRLHIGGGLNITLLDSLSFLPMKLAKMPSAMGLSAELRKGSFPFLYCLEANFHDVLDGLPDMKYYSPEFMSPKDRTDFLEWYEERKDQPFDFQEEILSYTRSDVQILREACTKFRKLVMEVTTFEGAKSPPLDVFAHVTLASSAMHIIRQFIMWEKHQVKLIDDTYVTAFLKAGIFTDQVTGEVIPENMISSTRFLSSQIPQAPVHGYTRQRNHSRKAIVWLEYISDTRLGGRKLNHARRGGEYQVPGTRFATDGYDPHTGEMYDFYGCR